MLFGSSAEPAVLHTNNRHRQAPRTHTDKQAVRTRNRICEPCLFFPRVLSAFLGNAETKLAVLLFGES